MSNKTKDLDLGSAPLGRLMVKFAFPCVVSLVVSALYNIVDQLFIANASYLGSYGNAANTAAFPLTVICLAIACMLGDGTNAYFTFCVGSGHTERARRAVGTAVTLGFGCGVVFAAVYIAFRTPLLAAFGAAVNEETLSCAEEYLFWIALGLPFYMLGQTLSPIICGDGSPHYAMISMLTGCAINIVGDPLLIYVAKWGMTGAAVATIAGQIVVCALNVAYILKRTKSIRLTARDFVPRGPALREIIPLGITSFFAQVSIVASMAAVNNMLAFCAKSNPIFSQPGYAQIPLAVVGIVLKFFQIIVSVAIGITAGCVPIIGYNRGAGRYARLRELLKKILTVEVIAGFIALFIFEVFTTPITYMFGAAHESVYYQDFAQRCIRIFLSLVVLTCFNKGVMIFLQGMGKPVESATISVVREIAGGVALPIVMAFAFGLDGIIFFMPTAELITFIFALIFVLRLRTELKAGEEAAHEAAGSASAPDAGDERVAETSATSVLASAPMPDASAEGAATLRTPRTSRIITIGRSCGAGGRTIGRRVAGRLGIPYYDAELLEKAAEESGLNRKFLESLDEKPMTSKLLYQFSSTSARQGGESLQSLANRAQAEVIERVADEGPCVIVGRRADRVLSGRDNLVRVFVTASPERRAERVAAREGIPKDNAAREVATTDRERAAYYNQQAGGGWGEAANYDVCLNTDRFGLEGAADEIVRIIEEEV